MKFRDRLVQAWSETGSLLCVGLDPEPASFPTHLRQLPPTEGAEQFCRDIIDATSDLVCAYKPNLAFFEALGVGGYEVLRHTVQYARQRAPGVVLIADAKRGDVTPTADAYVRSIFDNLGFDAATVNPYLGFDTIVPWVRNPNFGAFVCCRTSNDGSWEIQSREVETELGRMPLYAYIALRACNEGHDGNVGLVAGATHIDDLKRLRELSGDAPFLIPGVGAQGGDAVASVSAGIDRSGYGGVVVNVSRSVLYASSERDFDRAARAVAQDSKELFNLARMGAIIPKAPTAVAPSPSVTSTR